LNDTIYFIVCQFTGLTHPFPSYTPINFMKVNIKLVILQCQNFEEQIIDLQRQNVPNLADKHLKCNPAATQSNDPLLNLNNSSLSTHSV